MTHDPCGAGLRGAAAESSANLASVADVCIPSQSAHDCVDVDIELTDGEWLSLMKIAHQRDVTLNQLVNDIIRQQMERDEAEKYQQLVEGLTRIYALDEADGHELTINHAFRAVEIAAKTLCDVGLNPRDEFTKYFRKISGG